MRVQPHCIARTHIVYWKQVDLLAFLRSTEIKCKTGANNSSRKKGLTELRSINIQLFLESTKNIVTKSIANKKTNAERIDKTHQSIIPFMSIIHKSCNITNTNSENSCDVSSLSQAYVFFKLSQIQVINGYKYKLRSI